MRIRSPSGGCKHEHCHRRDQPPTCEDVEDENPESSPQNHIHKCILDVKDSSMKIRKYNQAVVVQKFYLKKEEVVIVVQKVENQKFYMIQKLQQTNHRVLSSNRVKLSLTSWRRSRRRPTEEAGFLHCP